MNNTTNIIRIQQYLKGELSPEEMNQLEREALDDPFLNDALEGYLRKGVNIHQLTLLQKRLQDRITEQPKERNRLFFTSQRLGIAAVACLLFILACVLLWMVNSRNMVPINQKQVAIELNTNEPIPSGNGLSIARKLTTTSGSPENGWENFNAYVKKSMNSLQGKGVVVLAFGVDNNGRPENIEAKKGNKAHIAEARRLLENGPNWEANVPVEIEFVFD